MKKLDKLILSSFFGPFFLTFLVVVFILLTQYMLKYFDDFVGKDLGVSVFAELIFYFSINMTQVALPLAILLSSLMTFGNLGEHFELTAIKASGISLVRTLKPVFISVVFIAIVAFFNNNLVVPEANIKAFSLLYDIRQKKPSLDIREGQFYNGIPNHSIKVNHKYPDEVSMTDVIIYDHTNEMGNNNVTVADSCRMYSILDNRYLVFELFNGSTYQEQRQSDFKSSASFGGVNDLMRSEFGQMKMVMSLSSFDLNRTKEELFAGNRLMKNMEELTDDIDSMHTVVVEIRQNLLQNADGMYDYHMKERKQKIIDSIRAETSKDKAELAASPESTAIKAPENLLPEEREALATSKPVAKGPTGVRTISAPSNLPKVDSATRQQRKRDLLLSQKVSFDDYYASEANYTRAVNDALVKARYIKTNIANQATRIDNLTSEIYRHSIEKHKKVALAFSCIIMFLIGAPLGAIIKKGGLGFPVILSIAFFVIFYIVSIMSEKYAREGLLDSAVAAWTPNMVLLPFGAFFLRQARKDSRLFETDVYAMWWDKLTARWKRIRGLG